MDTLKYFEALRDVGITEAEAKAHVYSIANTFDCMVTREDLDTAIKGLENGTIRIIAAKLELIEKFGGSLCIAIFILLLKIAFWPH